MSKQAQLIKQIDCLLNFLQPHLSLANCHMVDYFTNSAFNQFLPLDIQEEIQSIGAAKVIDMIFHGKLDTAPKLSEFIENSNKFTLENCQDICLKSTDFIQKLQLCGGSIKKMKLDIFMTPKKSHEVEIMSAVAAAVSQLANISHLIDIGDGKGYLSSMLALHHQIPVLGVDASTANTCGAQKRATKLSKVWNGISKAPKKSVPKKNDDFSSSHVELYKQVTKFIDVNFDFHQLLKDVYKNIEGNRLGLVGLHTCGNLASNSLRIFTSNPSIETICNVGCCYHLMDEKFSGDSDASGFPMSAYLCDKKIQIGRSARMIANQSVDRIMANRELPNRSIYYRALLQVLFHQYLDELPEKHVGKFRKQCDSFVDYARKAIKRIDIDLDIPDASIQAIEDEFGSRTNELNIFYLIRCRLAPVVECLILLDRLLFLYEHNIDDAFLVQLFDPVISPRCYAIVAVKQGFNKVSS